MGRVSRRVIATSGSLWHLVVRSAGALSSVGPGTHTRRVLESFWGFTSSRVDPSVRSHITKKARTVRGGRSVDIFRAAIESHGLGPGRGAIGCGVADTSRVSMEICERVAANSGPGPLRDRSHGNTRASRRLRHSADALNETRAAQRGGHARHAKRSGFHDSDSRLYVPSGERLGSRSASGGPREGVRSVEADHPRRQKALLSRDKSPTAIFCRRHSRKGTRNFYNASICLRSTLPILIYIPSFTPAKSPSPPP